jgi:hypothetical protein
MLQRSNNFSVKHRPEVSVWFSRKLGASVSYRLLRFNRMRRTIVGPRKSWYEIARFYRENASMSRGLSRSFFFSSTLGSPPFAIWALDP